MDPALTGISRRHGVFLRREALELGYSDRAIASMVRRGDWHRVRHGAYVQEPVWGQSDRLTQHLIRSRAAYRTADTAVALSHTSSLSVHGKEVWNLPLAEIDLTRLDGSCGRRGAGVRQHRGRVLPEDLVYDDDLVYMSATRTALEITTLTDVEHAVVIVNDLVHRGLTTKRRLENRFVGMEHWPGTLRTELVLDRCDPRPESVGENRFWNLCADQAVPRPIPQYVVRDDSGEILGRVDFAWPWFKVFVEFDGRMKYERHLLPGETAADAVMREKRREQLICDHTGWICIRVTWPDLQHPERVAGLIRRAFARAASHGQLA